ncbi:MAG: hypothetical protein R3C56_32195 [Pirellulaceae bacterium]
MLSPGVGRSVPSDYTLALELQATQPLMRGRGTLVNRIPVVLPRINEDIQLHDFEANVRNLVKSVEDAYWDLYCGYRGSRDCPRCSGQCPEPVARRGRSFSNRCRGEWSGG